MAKSKTLNPIILIGSILILAILVVIGVFFFKEESLFSGTNTLSVSEVSLKSSNPFFSGQAWIINFVQGELGQSYFGTYDSGAVTPDDVKSKTGDEKTIKDFSVKVEYPDQKCIYRIKKDENAVRVTELELVEWDDTFFSSLCTSAEAIKHTNNPLLGDPKAGKLYVGTYYQYSSAKRCFAIAKAAGHSVGYLENPQVDVTVDIAVEIDGEKPQSVRLRSLGKTSDYVGTIGYAQWVGNLDTGRPCESQDPYKAVYMSGIWRLVSNENFLSYQQAYNSLFTDLRVDMLNSGIKRETLTSRISNYNGNVADLMREVKFGEYQNRTSENNARITTVIGEPSRLPQTVLYLKADSVGIFTPNPKPQIVGTPKSDCFRTGEKGTVAVVVKNVGEKGNIQVYGECQKPFDITSSLSKTIDAGETLTYYLELTAPSSARTVANCVVKAKSSGGETKGVQVGVCVDPQQECTPDTSSCGSYKGAVIRYRVDGCGATIPKTAGIAYKGVGWDGRQGQIKEAEDSPPVPKMGWPVEGCTVVL